MDQPDGGRLAEQLTVTRRSSSVRADAVHSRCQRPTTMLHLDHDASEFHGVAGVARDRRGSRGGRSAERISGGADRGAALRGRVPGGGVLARELANDTPARPGRTPAAPPAAWVIKGARSRHHEQRSTQGCHAALVAPSALMSGLTRWGCRKSLSAGSTGASDVR